MLIISIPNFQKFNPRSDRANYTWFRMQNDFFTDQAIFGLNAVEKLLYMFILCEASKKHSSEIELNPEYVCSILRIDETELTKSLNSLVRLEVLPPFGGRQPRKQVRRGGKQPTNIPATNERNETNERTKDFSSLGVAVSSAKDFALSTDFALIDPDGSLKNIFKLRGVNKSVQERWLQAYPDAPWLVGEIFKALAWEESQPARRKKNFAAFMSRWFAKGWDSRKIQGPSGTGIDWSKVNLSGGEA